MQPSDSIENAVYVTTLPQILKDNGYFTIHCGKAHFGAIGTPGADPSNRVDSSLSGLPAGTHHGNVRCGKGGGRGSLPAPLPPPG